MPTPIRELSVMDAVAATMPIKVFGEAMPSPISVSRNLTPILALRHSVGQVSGLRSTLTWRTRRGPGQPGVEGG